MELLPEVRHMAALADTYTYPPERLQALQELTRGVELSIYRVSKPEEIAGAIEAAKNSGALALNALASVLCMLTARSSTSELPHYRCRPCTNSREWPRRAG
jgi:hypothetical protein